MSGVVHVELSAEDPEAAGKFYKDLLGWEIEVDENMNYVQFGGGEGGIGGGFNKIGENDIQAGTVIAYADVEDIEATLAKAESMGATPVMPKTEIPGVGWFGLFVDPSGNTVGLYTNLPQD